LKDDCNEAALGPALYYSILIAARKKGSKIIVYTSGHANKGIGSLGFDDQFYDELGTLAAVNG
jgi:hypothetical protein